MTKALRLLYALASLLLEVTHGQAPLAGSYLHAFDCVFAAWWQELGM